MSNILFVGPHPDDVELGCLGTIKMHLRKKDRVHVMVVTDGERGLASSKNNRVEESIKSLEKVGIPRDNLIPLHLPDTRVHEHRDVLLSKIEDFCIKNDIDTVYVNSNKDYHQDHVVVFEETLRAARKVPNIFVFESNSSTLSSFSPNYFVNISNFVSEKAEYLKMHESQNHKRFMKDGSVRSLARFRGGQTKRFDYAEAFEVFRMTVS